MTNSVSKKEIVFQRTKAFAALLWMFFFFIIKAEGQTTTTYTQQIANYTSTWADNGGIFNQNASEVGQFANNAGAKQSVAWRSFRTDGNGGGLLRSLQIGDEFVITVAARRAFGKIGFALLSSPSTRSNWADRENNYALSVNLDGPAYTGAGYGLWYIKYNGGLTSPASFGGVQGTYHDYTISVRLTAPQRANITITSSNGGQTSTFNDILLNNSNPITEYSIFLQDDFDGASQSNIFWKQATTVINTGALNIGASNTSYSISGIIPDGLISNSTSTSFINNLTKSGTGTITLNASSTYTGSTTVTGGTLSLNAASSLPTANSITINGGNLQINNNSALTSTNNITLTSGTLSVGTTPTSTVNIGALAISPGTTIDLGAGSNSFNLTIASTSGLASGNLTISNWSPSSGKRILITDITHINDLAVLDRINFNGFGSGAKLINTNELVPKFLYYTIASGSGAFSNSGSWLNGSPNLNNGTETIYVQPGFILTQDFSGLSLLQVVVAGTLIMDGPFSITTAATSSGGITNLGNITLNTGSCIIVGSNGTFTNSGSLTMSSVAYINMSAGSTWAGNGTIGANGTINFTSGGTVSSTSTFPNITVAGSVNFSSGTIGTTMEMRAGGVVTPNAPRYASGSTLIYNSGSTFNRGLEWSAGNGSTIGVTAGYPSNVTVINGTTINMTANGIADRAIAGDLTLGSSTGAGSLSLASMNFSDLYVTGNLNIGGTSGTSTLTLSTTAGGDLYLGGNWVRNAFGAFVDNHRAVFFNGASGNQTITGPLGVETFSYLIINKVSGNVQLNATNVIVNGGGASAGFAFQLLGGDLDLNGKNFTFEIESNGAGNNILFNGTVAKQVTGTGNFIFNYVGATEQIVAISRNVGSNTLTFASTVTVSIGASTVPLKAGVNFGSGLSVIAGTLRIDPGGFVTGNAPTYSSGSTLIYNSIGSYNRTTEWAATTGAGYPHHVIIQNNTSLTIHSTGNAGPILATGGDVTVQSGSSIITDAQANSITVGGALNINGTFNAAGMISGADLNVNGNLTIATTGALTLPSTSGSDLHLGGNWARNGSGTFTDNTRAVYLIGTNNVTVFGNGGQTFSFLRIQKTASSNTITLSSPVTISTEVSFTTGVVVTSFPDNYLIMVAGSSYTGGSSSSFVSGPMKKIGNTAFNFPVGKRVNSTNHYRYIGIGAGGAVTDDYIAEFLRESSRNRGWISPVAAAAGLQRVSYCEHWFLRRMVGTFNRSVTLTWTAQSNCNAGGYVDNLSELVVVQIGNSGWGDTFGSDGNNGITTPVDPQIGTITWNGPTNYLFFTLGSTDPDFNPLPFTLLSFNGRNRTKDIELNFSVKGNDEQQHYLIERSADGRNFSTLIKLAATINRNSADYTTLDEQPLNGWNYYRVTAVDYDNRSTQSQIIRVWFGNKAGNPSIYPNPVQGENVQLFTGGMPKGMYNVQVMGVDGKIILSRTWQFDGVQPLYNLSVPQLPAGMYYLSLRLDNQPPVQLKFVK
jgi:autotransporter-associated beta strand protein